MYQWYVMFKELQASKPTRAESISAALERPVQEAVQEAFGLHQAIGGDKSNPTLEDYFNAVEDAMPPRDVCPVMEWLAKYRIAAQARELNIDALIAESQATPAYEHSYEEDESRYDRGVYYGRNSKRDPYAFMYAVQRAQGGNK